jgi:hypothetical protein
MFAWGHGYGMIFYLLGCHTFIYQWHIYRRWFYLHLFSCAGISLTSWWCVCVRQGDKTLFPCQRSQEFSISKDLLLLGPQVCLCGRCATCGLLTSVCGGSASSNLMQLIQHLKLCCDLFDHYILCVRKNVERSSDAPPAWATEWQYRHIEFANNRAPWPAGFVLHRFDPSQVSEWVSEWANELRQCI